MPTLDRRMLRKQLRHSSGSTSSPFAQAAEAFLFAENARNRGGVYNCLPPAASSGIRTDSPSGFPDTRHQ